MFRGSSPLSKYCYSISDAPQKRKSEDIINIESTKKKIIYLIK